MCTSSKEAVLTATIPTDSWWIIQDPGMRVLQERVGIKGVVYILPSWQNLWDIYTWPCALFPVEVPTLSIRSTAPNTVKSLCLKQFCQIARLPRPILGNEIIGWEEGHGRVLLEEWMGFTPERREWG